MKLFQYVSQTEEVSHVCLTRLVPRGHKQLLLLLSLSPFLTGHSRGVLSTSNLTA